MSSREKQVSLDTRHRTKTYRTNKKKTTEAQETKKMSNRHPTKKKTGARDKYV